jgi:uncharacterized protein YhaN
MKRAIDHHQKELNQLAAERENYALVLQMKNIEATRANDAEKELATEREKVKPLVDAMERLRADPNATYLQVAIIDDALAKVKEGK